MANIVTTTAHNNKKVFFIVYRFKFNIHFAKTKLVIIFYMKLLLAFILLFNPFSFSKTYHMKNLIVIFLIFISFSCLSQNNEINTDINLPDNNNSLSVNTGNLPNQQAYNQNKAQQISISQMPQKQQSDNFQLVINSGSRTWGGSSGYSPSVSMKKSVHKKSKHFSFDIFDKLFDKKFNQVHHYKKKTRFKKCSAF